MRAKRSLGQNFLVAPSYQERIIHAVAPQPDEMIIEIGPGHGALTERLVDSGARVIAIELDRELIPELSSRFGSRENFHLIEADALIIDYTQLIAPAQTARVVANLPYYIATPILQRLIDARDVIREMTLMLQREVVDRITASPGGKEYGYLSVFVQFYCEVVKLFDVPPGAFWPVPKVYSSVIRLRSRALLAVTDNDEALFVTLAQVMFARRRKTLLNNLRAGAKHLGITDVNLLHTVLGASRIDPQRRAETLEVGEIVRLAEQLSNVKREICER